MDSSLRLGRASGRPASGRTPSIVGGFVLLALDGCDYVPAHAPMRYSLSRSTQESLADSPVVQDQIGGTLESFFGTPQNPGFLRTAEWIDEDFDPNYPAAASDDGGSGELSESQMEELRADNARRFAGKLEQAARGEYAGLAEFRSAPDLSASVESILADEELSEADRRASLTALFQDYYPSLRDSADM